MNYYCYTILLILIAFTVVNVNSSNFPHSNVKKQPSILIVGGETVTKNELPYQVSLRRNGKHICGGAIVTSDSILTAAHCVDIGTAAELTVVAGDHNLALDDGTEQLRNVSKVKIHEKYDAWTRFNDIAILTVASPLTLNRAVKNIPLPVEGFRPQNRSIVLISGWGYNHSEVENATALENILRKTEVPIVTDEECRVAYGVHDIIDSMICAGFYDEGGHDSCGGDDGGPLVCNFSDEDGNLQPILCGLFSWTHTICGTPEFPGVYTEVSYFTNWIQNNTRL